MTAVYRSGRPELVIEHVSGTSDNTRCLSSSILRVTSARRRLSRDQLVALNRAGLLGFGQTFLIRSQCDGKEEPAGYDDAIPTDIDGAGRPTGKPALNWEGKPLTEPSKEAYFVYECFAECDSSG